MYILISRLVQHYVLLLYINIKMYYVTENVENWYDFIHIKIAYKIINTYKITMISVRLYIYLSLINCKDFTWIYH